MKGHAELVKPVIRKRLMMGLPFSEFPQFLFFMLVNNVPLGNRAVALPQQAMNFVGDELLIVLVSQLSKQRTPDPAPAVVGPKHVIGYRQHTRLCALDHYL